MPGREPDPGRRTDEENPAAAEVQLDQVRMADEPGRPQLEYLAEPVLDVALACTHRRVALIHVPAPLELEGRVEVVQSETLELGPRCDHARLAIRVLADGASGREREEHDARDDQRALHRPPRFRIQSAGRMPSR